MHRSGNFARDCWDVMPVVLEVLSIQQKNFYSSIHPNGPGDLISVKKQPRDPRNKPIIYMFRGRVACFSPSPSGLVQLGAGWPRWGMRHRSHPCHPHPSWQEGRHRAVCLQQINREGCFCLSDWSRTIYSSVTPKERLVDLRALLL